MVVKRSKISGADESYEHGPLAVPRVPPSEQEPGFLDDLRARGEVLAVGEDWDGNPESLPAGVTWVVFPNGDVSRVRM